ncbi:MAG: hypothetical protein WC757_02125 [Candidatus Paceibacterota bacterium]|jgi:hypothetical protein
MNEKVIYMLTEGEFQQEAEDVIGRELTKKELEHVTEEFMDHCLEISAMIQASIEAVIDYNKLMRRNRNANSNFPHYKVVWKNENAYQKDFTNVGHFKNKEDADEFVEGQFLSEFDRYKIILVEKSGEKEMKVIGKGEAL